MFSFSIIIRLKLVSGARNEDVFSVREEVLISANDNEDSFGDAFKFHFFILMVTLCVRTQFVKCYQFYTNVHFFTYIQQ